MARRPLALTVALACLASLALAVAPGAAHASPAQSPQLIPVPSLANQFIFANTGGKSLCGGSVTDDGSQAFFVMQLPGSEVSGLYERNFLTGEEHRILSPAQVPDLDCGAASGDGKLYAFVGCVPSQGTCYGPLRVVDTATGTVTTVPGTAGSDALHPVLQERSVVVSSNHRFVFARGYNSDGGLRYDTQTGATTGYQALNPDGDETQPFSISADGQRVAYLARESTGPSSAVDAVEVYDYATGTNTIASSVGGQPVSGDHPRLTRDGRYVVFDQDSGASIIRMDLTTGTRTSIVSAAGGGAPNGRFHVRAVDDDGSRIAFTSDASNLTTGITYPPPDGGLPPIGDDGLHWLFLRDVSAGSTTLVSHAAAGGAPANQPSSSASFDASGSNLLFESNATDLIDGFTGPSSSQLYDYRPGSGTTTLVTTAADDQPNTGFGLGAVDPSLSATGGRVFFQALNTPITNSLIPYVAKLDTGAADDGGPTGGTGGTGGTTGGTGGTSAGTDGSGSDVNVGRVAGLDRYETAVDLSRAWFAQGVPVVFIASGQGYPDALAAGPAAAKAGGPLLLTTGTSVPNITKAELHRLRPHSIVVVGGPSAVSDAVVNALGTFTSGSVTREAGADRYATASVLSQDVFAGGANVAYVATGQGFPDALAGGAAAATEGGPVLLVQRDSIPAATGAALQQLHPSHIVVLGGSSAISPSVAQQLSAVAPVVREGGADRFGTSVLVSKGEYPGGSDGVILTTGENFPDALAAAPAARLAGAPLLLVQQGCIPDDVASEIQRLGATTIVVLGGTQAVSDDVLDGVTCGGN